MIWFLSIPTVACPKNMGLVEKYRVLKRGWSIKNCEGIKMSTDMADPDNVELA